MSFVIADSSFQHILRVLNTNVDGRQKVMVALTAIKGVGRRFSNLVCKKANVDMNKRYASEQRGSACARACACTCARVCHTLAFCAALTRALCVCSAGELNTDEVERLVAVIQNPLQFKIPTWFLNRRRDIRTGKDSQLVSNQIDTAFREDMQRMVKMRYAVRRVRSAPHADARARDCVQRAPRCAPRHGLARARPEDQDDWSPRPHDGCVEEEGVSSSRACYQRVCVRACARAQGRQRAASAPSSSVSLRWPWWRGGGGRWSRAVVSRVRARGACGCAPLCCVAVSRLSPAVCGRAAPPRHCSSGKHASEASNQW